MIQNKRKNSGSSSCDADYRPPPLKIRATSVSSPVSRKTSIIPEVPSSLISPKDEESSSFDNFMIKTDDTSSCDEDSETKFSTGNQAVIKRDLLSKSLKFTFINFCYQLTPEDEDRRKRRRERNKIAATKCRLKKRECINNLMRESETLEQQNVDLKTQLADLRKEYTGLMEMWQLHQMECKNSVISGNQDQNHSNNDSIGNQFNEQETIKDTNNNKHLQEQLPSLTPLINCNLSFDFY